MSGLLFANPSNWSQVYLTSDADDPNIPSGYVLQTSPMGIDSVSIVSGDGRPPRAVALGLFSGGWPEYGVASDDNSRESFPG